MTQAAVPSYVGFVAGAGQTVFALPFRVYAAADLEVYRNGTFFTNYTLAVVGASTCTMTMQVPMTLGDAIRVRRVTAREQLLDYHANDPFGAESHEAALDRLTAMIQDLLEELSRRPALPLSVTGGLRHLVFPPPAPAQLLGWDALGSALTTYPSLLVQVTVDPVSGLAYGKSTATVPAVAGESLLGVGNALVPPLVRVLGVTARVTTELGNSNGLTTFSVGGLDLLDGWGTGIARTLGTVTSIGDFRRTDLPITIAAADVTLLADAGLFDATGAVTVTAHWMVLSPDA